MNNEKIPWLQRPIFSTLPTITNEVAIFAGIILLAFVTRFYNLGTRVMSHDESLHTYFSWLLYRGQGYQHSPMMHGPYQFHNIALIYFLFGASDFTARIPSALFSIATVWMVWYWRRYLGKWGMLVAAFMMVISPYMLYYGRYVRNESFVGFSGILLLYSILRYLETGEKKYIYLVTAATLLHFTSKETAFIYTAQALVFLGVLFVVQITKTPWKNYESTYRIFVILLAVGILLMAVGGVAGVSKHATGLLSATETAAPANPTGGAVPATGTTAGGITWPTILLGLGVLGLIAAGVMYFLYAYIRNNIPKERSFDLLIVIFTFVIPLLSAFVLDLLNRIGASTVTIPTDTASVASLDPTSMLTMGIVVAILFAISIALGLLWNREWWKYGAIYWGIFTILYTTVFTNAPGFFTGVVGSLGYWLVQQGVERGSQPEYYYLFIQIPVYEFLPAIGTLVAIVLGVKKLLGLRQPTRESEAEEAENQKSDEEVKSETATESGDNNSDSMFRIFFGLMTWWTLATIISFSYAGERMPWLTYHMAWPMILFTGWAIDQIITSIRSRLADAKVQRNLLSVFVVAVFLLALFNMMRSLYGTTPPFQGTQLDQLQATSAFLLPLIVTIVAGLLLAYLMKDDLVGLGLVALSVLVVATFASGMVNGASYLLNKQSLGFDPAMLLSERLKFILALGAFLLSLAGIIYLLRMPRASAFVEIFTLTIFSLLAVQTMRTSFRASYIDYDDATEYMVYAHAATDVKDVIAQVTEISKRTAGGLNAVIAYDASRPDTGVSWPLVWYLRDFTALRSFDQPTRSLRDAVAVIVDQKNFDKIEPALGDGFYRFDYIRMWWPNQDYFNLTSCGSSFFCQQFDNSRILGAIANPDIREGIFDIWFNRDYTKYAQATGSTTMTLTTWQPSDQMRLYVRKDVAAKIWNYGVGPTVAPTTTDPYQAGTISLAADQIFNSDRYPPQGLNAPRAIAAGLNHDLYVADSRNHRILHIASDGTLLNAWGSYAAIDYSSGNLSAEDALKQAPLGTFNEPWGVAVGPDGSVYVADTWNHRIQKFTSDGQPIKAWGHYGQPVPGDPTTADSFWGPRGIAVDSSGKVYVADTGNKRIVVFDQDGNYLTEFGSGGFDPGQFDEPVGVTVGPDGTVYVADTWNQRIQAFTPTQDTFVPSLQWDVSGWYGQSLDNKPFIAVDANNNVYITDPEGYRIIEFTSTGQFVRTWGAFGSGPEEIGLAAGVAIDQTGHVWVTDAGNNRILRYTLP